MQNVSSKAPVFDTEEKPAKLNVNKLQAALCMAASAAVSVGLIIWIVKSIF